MDDIEDVFKSEFKEYLDNLSGQYARDARNSLKRIAIYLNEAAQSGDYEAAKKNIRFEKSVLSSISSISSGEVQVRLRNGMSRAFKIILEKSIAVL